MRITEIRGVHVDVTDSLRNFIQEKLSLLQKMCEGYSPCDVSVEIGKITPAQQKGNIWRAELRMSVPGTTFRVERVSDDLYAAIDVAKDVLKQQIGDFKKR